MRRLLIIVSLLLPAARYFIAGAQQINILSYNIEDGLVNNDINNIYQDSRGFIWLCTRGGLSLYDGSRFTNFTTGNGLTHDMVNDIFEIAPQEFIVAQNADGMQVLKNERMQPLAGSSNIVVNEFYRFKDNRLIATADNIGAVEMKGGSFKQIRPGYPNSVIRIAPLNDSVWFVIDVNFAAQFTDPQLAPKSELMPIGATALVIDSKQRIWMGTIRGLKLVDPSIHRGKSVSALPLPPSFDLPILRHSYIMDLIEDSQGNMWVGTAMGLVKVDKNGASVIYTQQNGCERI